MPVYSYSNNVIQLLKDLHYIPNYSGFTISQKDPNPNVTRWIEPSAWINSDNITLIEVAQNQTKLIDTQYEKARKIFLFVKEHLNYIFPSNAPLLASDIYLAGFGHCVQYSHLFVALCRASNVLARTVLGITSSKRDSLWNTHQWAEFMDNDGFWHQVDAFGSGFFDISDPRFFDFYYAEYQNPIVDWYYGQISIVKVELDLLSCLDLTFLVIAYSFLWLLILGVLDGGLVLLFFRKEKKLI